MGNHDVGRGMAAGAKAFLGAVPDPTKDQALAALDALGELYKGADAEFDDEFFGETPLSKLVAIAFEATPEQIASRDDGTDDMEAWYDGPYDKFRTRYEFC